MRGSRKLVNENYRFRIGDGPEYEATIPNGDYSGMSVVMDNDGKIGDRLTLHPIGGVPFEVPIFRLCH